MDTENEIFQNKQTKAGGGKIDKQEQNAMVKVNSVNKSRYNGKFRYILIIQNENVVEYENFSSITNTMTSAEIIKDLVLSRFGIDCQNQERRETR